MAHHKKLAKVHYNNDTDSFELWLLCDGEWSFSCSSKCRTVEGSINTTHIHYTFLKEVLNCIRLGYDVTEA